MGSVGHTHRLSEDTKDVGGQHLAWKLQTENVGVNEDPWSEETEGLGDGQKAWLGKIQGVGCKQKVLWKRHVVENEPKALSET